MTKEMWIISGLIGLLLSTGLYGAYLSEKEWQQFKLAHNCKVVTHVSSQTFNTIGIGTNGQATIGVGTIPSQKGWLCDDGVTYYR